MVLLRTLFSVCISEWTNLSQIIVDMEWIQIFFVLKWKKNGNAVIFSKWQRTYLIVELKKYHFNFALTTFRREMLSTKVRRINLQQCWSKNNLNLVTLIDSNYNFFLYSWMHKYKQYILFRIHDKESYQ